MSLRAIYFIGLCLVTLLLLISVYLQVVDGVIPCPLCTLQRLTFGLLGCLFLLGILLHARFWGRLFINIFCGLTAILGMLLAGRQIFMQHFAESSNNECAASLQYMIHTFPLNELAQKILLEGSAECKKRGFELLHLNMAEWAFIWFLLFFLLVVVLFLRDVRHH